MRALHTRQAPFANPAQTSPHNGRNLSAEDFGKAVVEALNTVPAYGTGPARMFIKGLGFDCFDLADLNTPGILEHIGSLTRNDIIENQQATRTCTVSPMRIVALLDDSLSEYIDAASGVLRLSPSLRG